MSVRILVPSDRG